LNRDLLTAAPTLLMWLGELITQRGIGNGISADDLRLGSPRASQAGRQVVCTTSDQVFS